MRADSFINTGGPASGSASSVFHVTFDVAQAESYKFTASLNSSNDFAIPTSDQVNIQLTNGGSNIFAPITAISVSGLELKGTLNPGTYVFAMDVSAASTDQSDNFVNYSVALADGNVAAGPVSNAVPLPSALTESLVMLGGLGIATMVRRRTPAWARASMV